MESVSSGTPTDAHRLVPLCVLLPDGDGTCCAGLLLLVVPLGPGRSCTLVDGGCEDTDCDEVDGLVNFTESGVATIQVRVLNPFHWPSEDIRGSKELLTQNQSPQPVMIR